MIDLAELEGDDEYSIEHEENEDDDTSIIIMSCDSI
jgi:hypothetical protein